MTRRTALAGLLAGATWLLASGHTPYQQWRVYRQRHLLILASLADPRAPELARLVAALLATHLPESRARVTRAPHLERVASLLGTGQLDVALLAPAEAAALLEGRPPVADHGPVPLRVIARLGDHLLVCREDFPARHAYLLARTLSRHRAELPVPLGPGPGSATGWDDPVPLHAGARAFLEGRGLPAADAGADAGTD